MVDVTAATSAKDSALISAILAPTRATWAGSFCRPRCGTGARNGLSVSTISRSSGQINAADRKSSAVLKVTIPLNDNTAPRSRHVDATSGPPVKQWKTVRSGTPSARSTSKVSSHADRLWITRGKAWLCAMAIWAAERFTLDRTGRVLIVIVEAALADRHDSTMIEQRFDAIDT